VAELAADLRRLVLEDRDPDVVRAGARALAQLGVADAVPDLRAAFERFEWPETRRDLADALARLGDPLGLPTLIRGLDYPDDLIRESCFEALFDVTGLHFGYEPLAPRDERLAAIARFERWWAKEGGAGALRHPLKVPPAVRAEVHQIVLTIGGTDGTIPQGDDQALYQRLLDIGPAAVPGLARIGLKFPSGFSEKRILVCRALGEIGHRDGVPALIAALRDPVVATAAWACDALAVLGDEAALPAVQRYHAGLLALAATDRWPDSAGTRASLIAQAAAARFELGDQEVEPDLVALALAEDEIARGVALAALGRRYGAELGVSADAPAAESRAALLRWLAGPGSAR
jgi:HEAT repeat protein